MANLDPHPSIFPLVPFDPILWPADSSATVIFANDIPEPYRGLLAHTEHMTVTVEDFYGRHVDVRVLEAGRDGDFYHRRIVLTLEGRDQIVQFGAVRIDLTCLSPEVRDAILEQKTPLGRVLIEHNVLRRIEPTAFLKVEPGLSLVRTLLPPAPRTLYGRTGVIFCNDRPAIAVLEVLCPAK